MYIGYILMKKTVSRIRIYTNNSKWWDTDLKKMEWIHDTDKIIIYRY